MVETGSASLHEARVNIRLPASLTRSHQQVIERYMRGAEPLADDDWSLLIAAMDALRRAEVVRDAEAETFAAIYDRLVDAVYSDGLIQQLISLADPESACEVLRAAASRRVLADLRTSGLWRTDAPLSQLLVAFCLYWWQMFVRGYAFEVAIYRDLAENGIVHIAHDLRNRQARLSGHDLKVMGFQGDVKTSTYFMLVRRSEALAHDFYITRMYRADTRRWHRAVWVKLWFWRVLNGEPTPTPYEIIWQVLPHAAQITLRGHRFVVVLYEEWKRRVIARQTKEASDV